MRWFGSKRRTSDAARVLKDHGLGEILASVDKGMKGIWRNSEPLIPQLAFYELCGRLVLALQEQSKLCREAPYTKWFLWFAQNNRKPGALKTLATVKDNLDEFAPREEAAAALIVAFTVPEDVLEPWMAPAIPANQTE